MSLTNIIIGVLIVGLFITIVYLKGKVTPILDKMTMNKFSDRRKPK